MNQQLPYLMHQSDHIKRILTHYRLQNHTKKSLAVLNTLHHTSLNYELMNFIIIPKYKISYKDYDEGVNKNRDDLIHDINFKVEYPLSDSLKISTFYDYSSRKDQRT